MGKGGFGKGGKGGMGGKGELIVFNNVVHTDLIQAARAASKV